MEKITIKNYEFEKINGTTKKAIIITNKYFDTEKHNIYECYKTCSAYKQGAEKEIKEQMKDIGVYGYYIISYCKIFFTCGYCVRAENGILYLIYHTPQTQYAIQIL